MLEKYYIYYHQPNGVGMDPIDGFEEFDQCIEMYSRVEELLKEGVEPGSIKLFKGVNLTISDIKLNRE